MSFFKRIFFFILVNVAVVAILMTVTTVFGIEPYLNAKTGLNLTSLAIYSAIIGFAGSFISLFISKWMAKSMMGVKVIKHPHSPEQVQLFETVQRLAQQGDFKMPEVGIYNSPEVNAFATGWGKNHSLVAVSSGLLQEMNHNEVEGVLAHEMAHIANGDMVTMTLIQGVVNTFVIFAARAAAYAVQIALGKDQEEIGGLAYWLTSIVFEIVFGILASLIVFWFSRRREFEADFGGAKFVGKQKMIAALKRLQELSNKIDPSQKSLATMKISDRPSGFMAAFSTHPRLEDRIAALQKAMV